MEEVTALLDQLNMTKWIVKKEEGKEEKYSYCPLVWSYECENENWKWRIDFRDDGDCRPGILGVYDIYNKHDETFLEGYHGDLLCQNTLLGQRENILSLLHSLNLTEYFDKKFAHFEQLEKFLEEHYIVKIPIPLRKHFSVNLMCNREVYRIELFDLETGKPLCVLIPLADETNDWNDSLQEGKYYLYIFPSADKIDEINQWKEEIYKIQDWSWNDRNLKIFLRRKVPFSSITFDNFSPDILSFISSFTKHL